jgi:RES domain-containing protein
MLVYRIGRTKYASLLHGEGARLNGGRWNHAGTPCIYASESRALALLEYTVNISITDIPRSLSITTIEIPDDFLDHPIAKLPGNWRDAPAPLTTKEFGTNALKAAKHAVLRFPSAVLPEEYNYILNPLHAESKRFRIKEVRDFVYDVRLKKA